MAIIKRSVGRDVEKSESLYILGLCLHLSVSQQLMWEILPLSVIICKFWLLCGVPGAAESAVYIHSLFMSIWLLFRTVILTLVFGTRQVRNIGDVCVQGPL